MKASTGWGRIYTLWAALAVALTLMGCPHEPEPEPEPEPMASATFSERLRDDAIWSLDGFADILDATELTGLVDERPITGFVPSDGALSDFEDANGEPINRVWAARPPALRNFATYQLLPEAYDPVTLMLLAADRTELPTNHPDGLTVLVEQVDEHIVRVDGWIEVDTRQAIIGDRYVIYPVLDGVLVPDELRADLPR